MAWMCLLLRAVPVQMGFEPKLASLVVVAVLVPLGVAIYGLALMALRFEGMAELTALLRRFTKK